LTRIGAGRRANTGRAGVAGVAVDVDQDIDAVVGDALGGLVVRHWADVGEVLDRRADAGVQAIAGLRPAVVGEDLDLLLVVHLEQLGHQVADGVVAQVRRDVADARAAAGQMSMGASRRSVRTCSGVALASRSMNWLPAASCSSASSV
jgi:hypothetical protein